MVMARVNQRSIVKSIRADCESDLLEGSRAANFGGEMRDNIIPSRKGVGVDGLFCDRMMLCYASVLPSSMRGIAKTSLVQLP